MNIKNFRIYGAFLAAAILVGCAGTDTVDDSSETPVKATSEQSQASRRAAEQAALDAARREAEEAERVANLQTVFYFDFDMATLSAEVRSALDKQVVELKGNNSKIRLEGHADERGTREYNMALGERRANAVANYLIINGVARYRVETVSYGEERPVDTRSTPAAWDVNRRVELK